MAKSKGIADAIPDSLKSILSLFKELGVVEEATLRRLYGPEVTPTRATTSVAITVQMVKDSLATATPLKTPHKDGWRAQYLLALTAHQDCATALTDVVGALASGDVTDATCDLLSSATLVILLKKTEEEMAAMRAAMGEAYLQPQRPLGMGGALTKLAVVCVLGIVEAAVGVAACPHQFAVNAKGGCDMVQWVLQIIMIRSWRGRH